MLIADASQNAMAGGYDTVAEGFVLVGTVMGWNFAVDWLAFRYNAVRRFAEAPPLVLVRRGNILGRNLRREYITVPELMASLREHGIDKLADVKIARMESDGSITVIRRHGGGEEEGARLRRRNHPVA